MSKISSNRVDEVGATKYKYFGGFIIVSGVIFSASQTNYQMKVTPAAWMGRAIAFEPACLDCGYCGWTTH